MAQSPTSHPTPHYFTHDKMREMLSSNPGKAFIADFTRRIYNWANNVPPEYYEYRMFNEFSIRYATDEKTKMGLQRTKHYRIDCILFVQPGYRALNQGQCYTVGIELKGAEADLKKDDKIEQYLGWTDFLLIGVPSNLIEAAHSKVEEIEQRCPAAKEKIGVMCVEDGITSILPKKQSVSAENYNRLYEQVLYNYMFKDTSAISFNLQDIDIDIDVDIATNTDINVGIVPNYSTTAAQHADVHTDVYTDTHADTYTGMSADTHAAPDIVTTAATNAATITTPQIQQSSIPQNQVQNPGRPQSQVPIQAQIQAEGNRMTDEERAARHQKYLENKKLQKERAAALRKRNRTLTDSVREQMATLPDRDQMVFWAVRDAGKEGIARPDVLSAIQQSPAGVSRSIKNLKNAGFVTLEGSPKNGIYRITGEAVKSSRCITCKRKDYCQGAALGCGSYTPE